MKGKAAIFYEPGKPYEITEMDVPDPDPGGILIRITLASICGSDLHIWRGDLAAMFPAGGPGRVSGHEMTGVVAKLGAGVTADSLGNPLKEGDRVVYPYFYPCLHCYQCMRGQFAACPNKMGQAMDPSAAPSFSGAYAEYYMLRPGGFVFKVPDDLSDDMIAPINCALSQVTYGLHRVGVQFGDTVVIQGAGGLGVNACAVAKEMGADRVICIDGLPERLKLARQFGADDTIDISQIPDAQDRIMKVLELTGFRGADVACDFVGIPAVVPEGINMVRMGGRYLAIGNISLGQTTPFDPAMLVWGNKTVMGVVMYDPWILPAAMAFLQRTREKYPFGSVVSHSYPLEKINEAFEQSEWVGRGDATKITRAVIKP